MATARHHSTKDDGGLTREDEAEEHGGLGEDEPADHHEHQPGREVEDAVEDVGNERLGQDDGDDQDRDDHDQGDQLTPLEPEDGRRGFRHRLILAGCVQWACPQVCQHWA